MNQKHSDHALCDTNLSESKPRDFRANNIFGQNYLKQAYPIMEIWSRKCGESKVQLWNGKYFVKKNWNLY